MLPETLVNVRLLSNVPFINDYKHVRYFKNRSEQDNYFNSRGVIATKPNCQPLKTGNTIQVTFKMSVEQAQKVSYLEFTNQKTGGKKYYCFVVGVKYEKVDTAIFYIELDMFQTFLFDVQFKKSYVERQHGVVTTIEDNVKLGKELITYNILDSNYDDLIYLVIVANKRLGEDTTESQESFKGTLNAVPTALFHYVVPYKKSDWSNITVKLQQSDINSMKTPPNSSLLSKIQTDWAKQVESYYFTKSAGIKFTPSTNGVYIAPKGVNTEILKFKGSIAGEDVSYVVPLVMSKDLYDTRTLIFYDVKQHLPSGYDPKCYQSPYVRYVLSDQNGNQLEIKPEYLTSTSIELEIQGSAGTMNKVGYTVKNYAINNNSLKAKQQFNMMMIDNEPNLLPIVVDQYSAYIQGNANSMQATRQTSLNNWQTSIKNSVTSGLSNTLTSGLNAFAMGMMNPTSAPLGVAGTVSAGVNSMANLMNTDRSGQNNFENLVMQQNAMLDDIASVPPNVKSIGGNPFFAQGHFKSDLRLTIKGVAPTEMQRISSYYDHFGYAVNQYTNINFNSNQYFNYVKTNECNVYGNLNQSILEVFRKIFNAGVFLHHTDSMTV